MAVRYDKLFHMMIDREISNVDLIKMAGLSANVTTRLKNEYIFNGKYRKKL